MREQTTGNVGVIVGRFQVHEPHEAHRELIGSVIGRHGRTIIVLGLSPLRNTINNPLDFRSRKAMLAEAFPGIEILYIEDMPDDIAWSAKLDALLAIHLTPHDIPVLYGSRDSFVRSYHGKHKTCVLEATKFVSGTEIRRSIQTSYPPTKDFRAGMIHATAQRFPTCFQTVDVAVVRLVNGEEEEYEILLVRKAHEKQWRLPGGFSDTGSESLEADARREVLEETGIEITDPEYVGSATIDDWRYRGEVDRIKTALFVANPIGGRPTGGDDVAEAAWFQLNGSYLIDGTGCRTFHRFVTDGSSPVSVLPEHQKLLDMLPDLS